MCVCASFTDRDATVIGLSVLSSAKKKQKRLTRTHPEATFKLFFMEKGKQRFVLLLDQSSARPCVCSSRISRGRNKIGMSSCISSYLATLVSRVSSLCRCSSSSSKQRTEAAASRNNSPPAFLSSLLLLSVNETRTVQKHTTRKRRSRTKVAVSRTRVAVLRNGDPASS